MLPLQVRVDLGTMAMKEYFAFPKAPALLEPCHQIVLCHIQDKCVIVSWPARTYLHQLCTNIGCSLEDLLEVMNDKNKWRESGKSMQSTQLDDEMGIPVVKMLNFILKVSKFEFQLHYHFQTNTFGKSMNSLSPLPTYGLNSSTSVLL